MLLNLGGPLLASSHAALYPLLPNFGACRQNAIIQQLHVGTRGNNTRRRRTRPYSAASGPRPLHPSHNGPEGVPSSLLTFQPPRATPIEVPMEVASSNGGSEGGAGGSTTAVAPTKIPAVELVEALRVRLIEESDLPDVSALLAEAFGPSILVNSAELQSEISVERLEQDNKIVKEIVYKKILRSIKSRCGARLSRGNFDLSNDALVLAVRDSRSEANAGAASVAKEVDGGGVADGGGGDGGDVVAVVELCLRQPDGLFPFNEFFPPITGWEPYMCNLAVDEKYRGNGYGKQLVRLCEHVATNHWGYERMYLHVDMGDATATGLYSSMGYRSIEKYDAPLWMRKLLGLPTIRYQVKHFKGRKGAAALAAESVGGGDSQAEAAKVHSGSSSGRENQ